MAFNESKYRILHYMNIPGATTTVIITVPVVYRYYVPLREQWDIEVTDNTCLIVAPELRPTLPPAIQSESMQIEHLQVYFRGEERVNAELQRWPVETTPEEKQN